jgi:hypothetical protein
VDESTLALMRQWGAPEAEIEMARALMDRHADDAPAEVWPENWDLWEFFMRVQTQWVFAGMAGVRVALRWEGIEPVAQALGWRRRRWRELVEALGVIENAVLVAEQDQRKGSR